MNYVGEKTTGRTKQDCFESKITDLRVRDVQEKFYSLYKSEYGRLKEAGLDTGGIAQLYFLFNQMISVYEKREEFLSSAENAR